MKRKLLRGSMLSEQFDELTYEEAQTYYKEEDAMLRDEFYGLIKRLKERGQIDFNESMILESAINLAKDCFVNWLDEVLE